MRCVVLLSALLATSTLRLASAQCSSGWTLHDDTAYYQVRIAHTGAGCGSLAWACACVPAGSRLHSGTRVHSVRARTHRPTHTLSFAVALFDFQFSENDATACATGAVETHPSRGITLGEEVFARPNSPPPPPPPPPPPLTSSATTASVISKAVYPMSRFHAHFCQSRTSVRVRGSHADSTALPGVGGVEGAQRFPWAMAAPRRFSKPCVPVVCTLRILVSIHMCVACDQFDSGACVEQWEAGGGLSRTDIPFRPFFRASPHHHSRCRRADR